MNSHQGFLASVERDLLGGDAHFPTGLKVLAALRRALDDPQSPVDRVTTLVSAEPLVVVRLLRLANCVTFNPRGVEVLSVRHAIQRVGFNLVRSAAAAVAIGQMRALSEVSRFADIADAAWLRSVQLSVLARLLAERVGHAPADTQPDEAGLCGLVSELGSFYLLQRAARYPSYSDPAQRAALLDLLAQHGPALTARLSVTLGLPDAVSAALGSWRLSGQRPDTAPGLYDLITTAAALCPSVFGAIADGDRAPLDGFSADEAATLIERAHAEMAELQAALADPT